MIEANVILTRWRGGPVQHFGWVDGKKKSRNYSFPRLYKFEGTRCVWRAASLAWKVSIISYRSAPGIVPIFQRAFTDNYFLFKREGDFRRRSVCVCIVFSNNSQREFRFYHNRALAKLRAVITATPSPRGK